MGLFPMSLHRIFWNFSTIVRFGVLNERHDEVLLWDRMGSQGLSWVFMGLTGNEHQTRRLSRLCLFSQALMGL